MHIVEVKNNLVKVSYAPGQENLVLSGFAIIKDSVQAFIAQVVFLEANEKGNFGILKLLFNFDENGVISNYNGTIPDINAKLDIVYSQELLELLPAQTPILLGDLAQQGIKLTLDIKLLEEKLLICSEKSADNEILIKNLAKQLAHYGKKLVVFDLNGNLDFSPNKIVAGVSKMAQKHRESAFAGETFKLPLNYDSINFIYNTLDNVTPQAKALIQEVFLEVQEYVKSLPESFIPFNAFKDVVDDQYKEMGMVELLLLKNKLLKYYEAGVFAQNKKDFSSLKLSLKHKLPTIVNLSRMDSKVQREIISYTYSLLSELDAEAYVIVNINNDNSDKKLLKQIFSAEKAHSAIICSYSYKYLKELKQLSKDLILFAPIQQQTDFAGYNMFLNKLNAHEFVIYGQITHHMPLIVTLSELPDEVSDQPQAQQTQHVPTAPQPVSKQDLLDEQIRKDVDQIYTAQKSQPQQAVVEEDFSDEELTEEDLDLIDDLGMISKDEEDITKVSPEIAQETLVQSGEQFQVHPPRNQAASQAQTVPEPAEIPEPPDIDIIPNRATSTPVVPIYSADIEPKTHSNKFDQGDSVIHPKYGQGTVEKLIVYGNKTLCSINFDNVGRRLLDPALAEIKKI